MCCIYSGSRFLRCPKNKIWPELCRSIEFRESKGDFRLILPANRGLKWRKLVSLLFVSSVIVFHFPTSAGSCAQVKPLLGLEPFFPTWFFLQGCRDASSQLKHLPQSGNVSNHQDDSLPRTFRPVFSFALSGTSSSCQSKWWNSKVLHGTCVSLNIGYPRVP